MKAWLALALVVIVAGLATVPWIGNAVVVQFGISVLLLAAVAQGWNIIGGFTGYPSFGNSVFYGLGAYGVAIAMAQFQLPFWVGLLVGLALGVVFAGVLGLAVLRLKGHYFAICTLGLAFVMTAIVSNLELAGTNIGLVLPLLKSEVLFYELALGLVVLATRITSLASMFFGVVIVVAVVFMPRGIAHMTRHLRGMGWRYFIENVRSHRI